MNPFTFKTLSIVRFVFSAATIVFCLHLSGCSRTELSPDVPSGEQPSTAPFITDVNPHLIIPNYPFVVTGGNFDPTLGNNTLTIGGKDVTITVATTSTLIATLPADFPSADEYQVSVKVNGQIANFSSTVKVVSVYAVGVETIVNDANEQIGPQFAKYWKNGVTTTLTDGTSSAYATGIFVTDKGDVHIVGNEGVYSTPYQTNAPFYWKNGVKTKLSIKGYSAEVNKVVVDQDVVYVGGHYSPDADGSVITYWINGVQQDDISAGFPVDAYSTSLTVSNGDVYITGTQYDDKGLKALYWKNGIPVDLSPSCYPWEMAIVKNDADVDVYVVGYNEKDNQSIYWFNGAAKIPNLWDSQCIASSGNDIYIGGNTNVPGYGAGYWQVGSPSAVTVNNPDISHRARGYAIAVSGSDVFVAGTEIENNSPGSRAIAKFWVNGREYKLSDGTKYAAVFEIFVK